MSQLRKWQPARVQKRSKAPERLLALALAATAGYFTWHWSPGAPGLRDAQAIAQVEAQRAERARAQAALAAARQKFLDEQAERDAQLARLKVERAREQAAMFDRRYNTDRTPVGSTGIEGPAAPRAPSPGFTVVRPALPAGSPAAGQPQGFRELPKWRP